jgi:hypothetical protein
MAQSIRVGHMRHLVPPVAQPLLKLERYRGVLRDQMVA